jgi:hypothetical protein
MAHNANIAGVSKALAECTVADAELMANGELPAAPGLGRQPTTERMWASLAQAMRNADAATVGDLGDVAVGGWESALGLHYGSATDVLRSLGKPKVGHL